MSDAMVVGDPSGPELQCYFQAIHPHEAIRAIGSLLEAEGLAPVRLPRRSRNGGWRVYATWSVELDAPAFDSLVALRLDPRDHLACGSGLRASRPRAPVAAWVSVQREWRRPSHAAQGVAVAPLVGLSWAPGARWPVFGGAASWAPSDRSAVVELIVASGGGDPLAELVGGWRWRFDDADGRRTALEPALWLGLGAGGGVRAVAAAELGVWLGKTGLRLRLRPEATWGTDGWTVGGGLLVDVPWVFYP